MKNVLYLHTHDTGRWIAPYGYAVDTPALDRFARGAALFRRAFDCGPTCSPARASLLTGQYPHRCGMFGLAHRGARLDDPARHLAHFLKDRGFHTALAGIQHETADDRAAELGYAEILPSMPSADASEHWIFRHTRHTAETACDFLKRPRERPFFLSVGLFATHRDFPERLDPEDDPDYLTPPPPVPDTPDARLDWARFRTQVRDADRAFGRVLDALAGAGRADDTLVLVTTDHGPAFPGMKGTLSDFGCGVMMMLRVPGAAPRVSNALVTHLDFYPTVCEWLDAAPPPGLDGASLFPLLRGDADRLRDAVFAELNFHAARDLQRTVRTDRYRYVRRYDDYPGLVRPNIDDGPTKRFLMREAGMADWPGLPREQFFDLYRDPAGARSFADDPAYADALADHRRRLDDWMRDTDDPLRSGTLAAPAGYRLNPQADRDPNDVNWE